MHQSVVVARKRIAQVTHPIAMLIAAQLFCMTLAGVVRAQVPYGLDPLPTVAGVPFHSNVFGAAATDAAASKVASPRPIPGAPRDVYIGHASVYMWVDGNGEARYSAAVALHSVTFSMSLHPCRLENNGDKEKCQLVYDGATPALAVIKASDGGFYFAAGKNRGIARKKGLEACASRPNVTCKFDKAFGH